MTTRQPGDASSPSTPYEHAISPFGVPGPRFQFPFSPFGKIHGRAVLLYFFVFSAIFHALIDVFLPRTAFIFAAYGVWSMMCL